MGFPQEEHEACFRRTSVPSIVPDTPVPATAALSRSLSNHSSTKSAAGIGSHRSSRCASRLPSDLNRRPAPSNLEQVARRPGCRCRAAAIRSTGASTEAARSMAERNDGHDRGVGCADGFEPRHRACGFGVQDDGRAVRRRRADVDLAPPAARGRARPGPSPARFVRARALRARAPGSRKPRRNLAVIAPPPTWSPRSSTSGARPGPGQIERGGETVGTGADDDGIHYQKERSQEAGDRRQESGDGRQNRSSVRGEQPATSSACSPRDTFVSVDRSRASSR